MKLSELTTLDEVIAEHRQDPEFAELWGRTTFAGEVATRIVTYRADHGMTQTELAKTVA